MHKIGLIAPLSGPNEKIGLGMWRSLEIGLELGCEDAGRASPLLDVAAYDDHGHALGAMRAYERCLSDGMKAIVGPPDSESMRTILEAMQGETVPVISTIATATPLSQGRKPNFFRLTTPDAGRVEMLLQKVHTLYPGERINVYTASGSPHSYAQNVKRDVLAYLQARNWTYEAQDYSTGIINIELPDKGEPVVVCAVSSDAVALLGHLRENKCRNQAFGLGSNSNWLHHAAIGTIVVADLDRASTDPRVRKSLIRLEEQHNISDPSLPTVNAGYLLEQMTGTEKSVEKAELCDALNAHGLRGIFGPVAFTRSGEMAGFEQVTLLRVLRSFGRFRFTTLRRKETPTLHERDYLSRQAQWAMAIIGTAVGIISLLLALL